MEETKEMKRTKKDEERRLYRSFLKGMSEILVFGKKPKTKKFYNYIDALNHDISFLREDFIEALVKIIEELPPEKKIELKNEWDNFTFELEDDYYLNNWDNE